MTITTPAIRVEDLAKTYGGTRAVRGVSFEVPEGTVLGLLGPNGAGKTTTVRMLSTLVKPDSGKALIHGYDVARQAREVRCLIGMTGQYAAVDEDISGWENLYLIGRLLSMGRAKARSCADEMLERFRLTEAGGRPVKGYSGGMRRRLDLAASLLGDPKVLFLDEPTTGLDPRSRNELWDEVRGLAAKGTTVLLTTQYMEEAEALADAIVVIDQGEVIASGTASELRERIGGPVLHITPQRRGDLAEMRRALELAGIGPVGVDEAEGLVRLPLDREGRLVTETVRVLGASGIPVARIDTQVPSLDDVFLTLTGAAPVTSLTAAGRTGAETARSAA
ncbi:ATP-binding cassette domain-containing protein [Streptomyces sp. XD-27]|uniref:ATP-binding cassette domain-containing protein n=1 Tax=Streptomyces sp. XD-27 TaxID=3062779 RepID=UPI0026F455D5|nr:ATP-binding cassette domain-containing protein [Streptomyces sp. XD-27]WKX69507.1 ATP-binding cassette domain-containing protein [Streptomyces sp. XD-27]